MTHHRGDDLFPGHADLFGEGIENTQIGLVRDVPVQIRGAELIALQHLHRAFAERAHRDLLLEVHFRGDERFTLDGRNIVLTLPVAPWEAALGATVPVPTLGGDVELRIPAGSDSGRKLRLRGRGWPGATAGDQIVTLEVRVPKAETAKQKELYQALADEFDFDPRA